MLYELHYKEGCCMNVAAFYLIFGERLGMCHGKFDYVVLDFLNFKVCKSLKGNCGDYSDDFDWNSDFTFLGN